jgi:hypothetical protein
MFESLILPDDPEPARWARLRRAPREGDRALTGTARQWLRRLPARRRPLRLCEEFPRVANRIAWCWHDPALAEQALDDLLTDRRGGRRGFPPPIVRELQRLREFNDHQRTEDAPETWWQAVGRVAGLE